jgi:hypothetical protein
MPIHDIEVDIPVGGDGSETTGPWQIATLCDLLGAIPRFALEDGFEEAAHFSVAVAAFGQ